MNQFTVSNGEIVSTPSTRQQKLRTRILTFLLALGAILSAGLLASPESHADANSYINRLEEAGYTGPVSTWIEIGQYVCNAQARGQHRWVIARTIVLNTGAGVYTADANEVIDIANAEYCYLFNT